MKMLPGVVKRKFYESAWFSEMISSVPILIASIAAAWESFKNKSLVYQAWFLVFGAILLLLASIIRIWRTYKHDTKTEHPSIHDGLFGALYVLYGGVENYRQKDGHSNGGLRVTIHRIVEDKKKEYPEELEQLLPYIGGSNGCKPGRRFSIRSGIIGKAAREKAVFSSYRENDDYELFVKELVSIWSYTEEDAKKLTSDRKSWMAVPIFGKDDIVIGVVYLDSNEKDFFTDNVQEIIINACTGVADYISNRYE